MDKRQVSEQNFLIRGCGVKLSRYREVGQFSLVALTEPRPVGVAPDAKSTPVISELVCLLSSLE
jgi:hypothetical protein